LKHVIAAFILAASFFISTPSQRSLLGLMKKVYERTVK
jgi:hypothetical protein